MNKPEAPTDIAPPNHAAGTGSPLDLDKQLCFKLYTASKAVTRLYQPVLKAFDLTYPQYLVLLCLWQRGTATVNELCEALDLANNTVTPLLTRLTERGLIKRTPDPDDARKRTISLTEQGKALKAQCQCVPHTLLAQVGADADDLKGLFAQLDTLISAVNQALEKGA